ncbi:beta-phosphoglucomutase-like phosphatase (HAD superfamily) [Paenibacillus sp. OAS669]|nr:beta-phosphoglucomutase-like phosphatase (HAD superfamily) [Paenibacillus sp. OAS669]
MIKSLIFDFDGLILDTETPDFESFRKMFEEHGAELSLELWGRSVGRMAPPLNRTLIVDYDSMVDMPLDEVIATVTAQTAFLSQRREQDDVLRFGGRTANGTSQ